MMVNFDLVDIFRTIHSLSAILTVSFALVHPVGVILTRNSYSYPNFLSVFLYSHVTTLLLGLTTGFIGIIQMTLIFNWNDYLTVFNFQLKLLLIIMAFILGSLLFFSLIHLGKQIDNYPNLELKVKFLRKSDQKMLIFSLLHALVWFSILILGSTFYFNRFVS